MTPKTHCCSRLMSGELTESGGGHVDRPPHWERDEGSIEMETTARDEDKEEEEMTRERQREEIETGYGMGEKEAVDNLFSSCRLLPRWGKDAHQIQIVLSISANGNEHTSCIARYAMRDSRVDSARSSPMHSCINQSSNQLTRTDIHTYIHPLAPARCCHSRSPVPQSHPTAVATSDRSPAVFERVL
ncbi:uncharacterized protein LY79DRAFT_406081 [Colletotrichum navitas]|uniref:Uncharacterized protein n=1 Tax=Colletotrichum navitas TaxID=681940 RepID=A0AAD8Q8G0_9PEZI|nr:uncharacterized protein LY79DRAFT_406081 [Colletotrichum navitas]KAK1597146.1 hypothetical protein LY79DRAFT_406081 [Colletotrichum navitas]